ncbi:MAG TPA: D-serine ammonia-lyase, partial [Lachnospiraceae bacterium]|nr:D-serine ammonia-lyase [Lachnospiraceae bacterium]
YTIAVGSTGNLGLSIGIAAAAFGFHAVVHLSQDAKEWKKQELKKRGVTVVEYAGDYEKAVEEGRKAAEAEEYTYFIDDENSKILFSGYTTAAWELAEQLAQQQIITDRQHPLFVYLPCGVGGGPGGITFGLKQIFGSSVHCFFAEPTHAPCMMLSLATGRGRELGIKDFGLDNKTEADGLAVGRASGFAAAVMGPMLDGCYTVGDEKLFAYLKLLAKSENKKLEPSALAGMGGPYQLFGTKRGKEYLEENGIEDGEEITHVVWATGGGLVPEDVMRTYLSTG